jgi:hypothetical protein
MRFQHHRTLVGLRRHNEAAFRTITAGDSGGGRVIDPDTLENLQGLGYVN